MKNKKIRITCKGADELDIDELEDLQGGLKEISGENLEKLKRSIIEYGFSFPEFVWKGEGKNYIIDGHQRVLAVRELISEGYSIGKIPIDYIEARDREEAKKKLLLVISQYGKVTGGGLEDFIVDIDLEGFDDLLELPGFDVGLIDEQESLDEKKVELKPYNKTHILISVPPDKLIEIQDKLNYIKNVEGIEYEQGSN